MSPVFNGDRLERRAKNVPSFLLTSEILSAEFFKSDEAVIVGVGLADALDITEVPGNAVAFDAGLRGGAGHHVAAVSSASD
jgi:hypothetical protein